MLRLKAASPEIEAGSLSGGNQQKVVLGKWLATKPDVLILDEPEIHLHPEWQWLLVEALQQVFPNVQLIIASHSPIILASVKTGQSLMSVISIYFL